MEVLTRVHYVDRVRTLRVGGKSPSDTIRWVSSQLISLLKATLPHDVVVEVEGAGTQDSRPVDDEGDDVPLDVYDGAR